MISLVWAAPGHLLPATHAGDFLAKGYFFTLDAFIAVGIVTAGLFIILTAYSFRPITVQGAVSSNDLLLALENTKVEEVNSNFVHELIVNGSVENPRNTVMQQAGEFYFNRVGQSSQLINATSYNLVPQQYGINVSINNSAVYTRGFITPQNDLVVVSRSIVFGVYNDTFWGPFSAEVTVWR